MIEMITPSEDYLNEWYNTRAWATLSLRKFRESVDTGSNELQNHEVIEAVKLHDSLRNLQTPNGWSNKDIQTILNYRKAMIEKGKEDDMYPSVKRFVEESLNKIIEGKNPDVAFKYKGEVSGESGLDKTNPPEYIFHLTDAILDKGISLNQASIQVATKQVQPSQKHMYKMFMEEEEWRLQGYVNWRFYRQINSGKTEDLSDLNDKQNKYLNEYWGKWLFKD